MDVAAEPVHSKQALLQKAAWFSFLVPLSTGLIIVGYFAVHKAPDAPDAQIVVERCVLVGEFFISIASLIMGVLGLFAKSVPVKMMAVLGIIISCIVGFDAFILSVFVIWGFWGGC